MRQSHQVSIADHLWEAFDEMALEMGADRDALINQAMHMFARLNGYLATGMSGSAALADELKRPAADSPSDDDPGRREVAQKVLETAAALEQAIQTAPPPVPVPPLPPRSAPRGRMELYLMLDSGTLEKMAKNRFVIGRGKHCDLVIDSGKISREHAVISREGDDYYIEDLGSSNGTWHKQARIQRRKIADGDEYFICAEKIRCVLR